MNQLDPGLNTAIALGLEKAINMALAYDPGTTTKLEKLHGKTLECHCHQPDMTLYFHINTSDSEEKKNSAKIEVNGYREELANTTISGSLVDILLLLSRSNHSLADSGVSLVGSSALLVDLQSILAELDIDWEQLLIDLLANPEAHSVPGHQLAGVLKTTLSWLGDLYQKAPENLGKYLQEEAKINPGKAELEVFYAEVNFAREKTERLDAKISRLIKSKKEN